MTPDEAEAAAYRAWSGNDTLAWDDAVAKAQSAGLSTPQIEARLAVLDEVAERCIISRTNASFWRKVLNRP